MHEIEYQMWSGERDAFTISLDVRHDILVGFLFQQFSLSEMSKAKTTTNVFFAFLLRKIYNGTVAVYFTIATVVVATPIKFN